MRLPDCSCYLYVDQSVPWRHIDADITKNILVSFFPDTLYIPISPFGNRVTTNQSVLQCQVCQLVRGTICSVCRSTCSVVRVFAWTLSYRFYLFNSRVESPPVAEVYASAALHGRIQDFDSILAVPEPIDWGYNSPNTILYCTRNICSSFHTLP